MTYKQPANPELSTELANDTHCSSGVLIISLDFESYWGMRDSTRLDDYLPNLLGLHHVVPALLELFSAYDIHATWAVVGLLACANKEEALASMPSVEPKYKLAELSPYAYLRSSDFVDNEQIHFAPSLIQQLVAAESQEVASHTFSHYYCLEDGQTLYTFRSDLIAAMELFQRKYEIKLRSIVFPRNQYSKDCIKMCKELGIISFRGNSAGWWNMPRNRAQENLVHRFLRLTDSYFNISGYHSSPCVPEQTSNPVNIPASRFLRPCPKNVAIRQLQMRRIKAEMHHAAQYKRVYHLWWHPHNFGAEIQRNLNLLEDILKYFSHLRSTFGMQSMNMQEYASNVISEHTI